MFGTVFCVAAAVLGVDIGWQPNAEGELQYIIQLQPEMAEAMFGGRPVEFDLRPEHQGVRHFRIQVGRGSVPREGGPSAPPAPPAETATKGGQPPAAKPQAAQKPPAKPPAAQGKPAAPPVGPTTEKPAAIRLPGLPAPTAGGSRSAPTAEAAPNVLQLDPHVRPLGDQRASFDGPAKQTEPGPASGSLPAAREAAIGPLLTAWGTAGGLLAALVYLGWVHVGTRRRYRALLADYYAAVGSVPGGGAAAAG